jgi:transcriptional antiterminator Rof (Rho-off)
MTKSTDYQPIACALHDEYEIAIMQNRPITISWTNDSGQQTKANVSVKDLIVRDKEEFLLVETPGDGLMEIRLDKITLHR